MHVRNLSYIWIIQTPSILKDPALTSFLFWFLSSGPHWVRVLENWNKSTRQCYDLSSKSSFGCTSWDILDIDSEKVQRISPSLLCGSHPWGHVPSLGSCSIPGVMFHPWGHVPSLGSCSIPGVMFHPRILVYPWYDSSLSLVMDGLYIISQATQWTNTN